MQDKELSATILSAIECIMLEGINSDLRDILRITSTRNRHMTDQQWVGDLKVYSTLVLTLVRCHTLHFRESEYLATSVGEFLMELADSPAMMGCYEAVDSLWVARMSQWKDRMAEDVLQKFFEIPVLAPNYSAILMAAIQLIVDQMNTHISCKLDEPVTMPITLHTFVEQLAKFSYDHEGVFDLFTTRPTELNIGVKH